MPAEIELNAPGDGTPTTAADFQQAALKAFEENPEAFPVPKAKEVPAPPAPAKKEAQDSADPAAGEEPAAKPQDPPAPEPKKEDPPKEPDEGPELVALAKKDAELRKRERALKDQERANAERLTKAEVLLKAIESGDVLGLIAAGGFNYRQVVEQIASGKQAPGAKPQAKPAAGEDQIAAALAPMKEQLSQLQNQVLEYQAREHRQKLTADAEKIAKDAGDKFKFTVARGKLPDAVRYLEEHWQSYGELPAPGDYPKSMRIALEAVEHQLREEAKSWEPLLTGKKEPVTTPGTDPAKEPTKEAGSPPGRTGGITTLTNRTAAPRATDKRPVPKTPEEYQREALEALSKESTG